MRPLRVLFTNLTLASRTGTELYIKDAALGLLRRGHSPVVYSPDLGDVAEEIRAAGCAVVDDVAKVGSPPDLIHGHHHQQTVAALLRFPGVPAVFVAHDFVAWHDKPPLFPRILRYVAVDGTNRDRLVLENGIPEERVRVLLNFVDLERFRPRGPLPERPRRALVFSNYARNDTHLPMVEDACRRAGLELDVVGSGVGRSLAAPETLLGEYDLVFAKARSALEALAVGTAVILCDFRGLGGLVTSADFDRLRWLNFGLRTLSRPAAPELIHREIERYDPRDAAEVSRRIRETAGLETALDHLEALYEEVLAESARRGPADLADELRAASAYLHAWSGWAPFHRSMLDEIAAERHRLAQRVEVLTVEGRGLETARQRQEVEGQRLEAETQRLEEEKRRLEKEKQRLAAESHQLEAEKHRLEAENQRLTQLLSAMGSTLTWRLREALLRVLPHPGKRRR